MGNLLNHHERRSPLTQTIAMLAAVGLAAMHPLTPHTGGNSDPMAYGENLMYCDGEVHVPEGTSIRLLTDPNSPSGTPVVLGEGATNLTLRSGDWFRTTDADRPMIGIPTPLSTDSLIPLLPGGIGSQDNDEVMWFDENGENGENGVQLVATSSGCN